MFRWEYTEATAACEGHVVLCFMLVGVMVSPVVHDVLQLFVPVSIG